MSLVVTAVFTPLETTRDRVLDALNELIPLVHEEEGCLLYAIHEQPDGTIVMIEKWESAELLDAHSVGRPVTEFGQRLDGLLAHPAVVTRLTALPVGDPVKGAL